MGDEVHSLFVIHSGMVKVYRLSDTGKEQILRWIEPGDFLGRTVPVQPFTHAALRRGFGTGYHVHH